MTRRGAALAFAFGLSGCVTPAPMVDFAAAPVLGAAYPGDGAGHGWRAAPYEKAYREVQKRWTRRAHVTTRDWDTALDAWVTLASPEYRAAYVRLIAGMRALPDSDRQVLAEQQRADADAFVEVWVAMETSRWEWNDLTSSKSVWTVTLSDGAGRSVEAVSRSQVPAKPAEVAEMFPGVVSPFTMAWRVRFPVTYADGSPVLRADATRLSARFAGPLGTSEVVWQSR